MVVVRELVKRFGDLEAVSGVNFSVAAGEAFGFLGPNGAGKSTTISILCTLLTPSGGSASVAGCDVVRDPLGVRRRIGLVFQDPTLDEYLTAEENLRFHAQLYRVPRAQVARRLDEVLEMVELSDRRGSLVRTFSGGMKRRLEIARGLMHSPQVLFLDEPTVGLDPQTRSHIWSYINELRARERITLFLTTHYMDEAENCDRIAIIDHGEIVATGSPEVLEAAVGKDRIELHVDDPTGAIAELSFATTSWRSSARDSSSSRWPVPRSSPRAFWPSCTRRRARSESRGPRSTTCSWHTRGALSATLRRQLRTICTRREHAGDAGERHGASDRSRPPAGRHAR